LQVVLHPFIVSPLLLREHLHHLLIRQLPEHLTEDE
jgi:hypothetical protein